MIDPTISLSSESDREFLRARIRVAVDLAIGNSPVQAIHALEGVAPIVDPTDHEIVALYFQARAIADIKMRCIEDGFGSFEHSLAAARDHAEPALCARILINYGTALTQDGDVTLAIASLEEALAMSRKIERTTDRRTLEKVRALASTKPVALVSLAEAHFAAGALERAATLLREFHTMRSGNSSELLSAAAVGIPLGLALADETLLKQNYDPSLLDLAFARHEEYLRGPLVEAFCTLFEQQGRPEEHDALLARALDALTSLDNSLALGIRLARLGIPRCLPRISALMARQCSGTSTFLRAHQDLFDSFVAARRQLPKRSRELGLRAERAFANNGRPFMRALALQAAGLPSEADALLRRHGGRTAPLLRWNGSPIKRRLAAALTAREHEVSRLAANGMTNPAIAAALHLSERTVHHHCEAIFGKLGIRSRWQLPAALADVSRAPSP